MAGLSGDIDIPHVGKLPKWAVLGGVGVTGFLIWKHYHDASSSAAAPAGAAGGDPYPSDGTSGNPNDPYSLDPATGVTYGDEAASGSGTGYGGYDVGLGSGGGYGISSVTDAYPWDGTYSNPSDPYAMDPSTGQTYGNEGSVGSSPGITTTAGPPFSTNSEWSQYALNYFSTNGTADTSSMAAALGAYLAGQPLDASQQDLVNEAIAVAGKPPVAGPGNYPPSIRPATSNTGGTSPSGSGGGSKTSYMTGGHVVSVSSTRAEVAWTPHGPANRWQQTITGPGKINGFTNVDTVPHATYEGLEPGHTYDVRVTPLLNGKPNGPSGTVTFVTRK